MIYLTLLLIAAFAGTIITGWIYIRRLRIEVKELRAQRRVLKDVNVKIDAEKEGYRKSRDTWKSIAINHMALIKKIANTYYISGNCEATGWRFRVNPEDLKKGIVHTRHPRKRDGRYEPVRYDV